MIRTILIALREVREIRKLVSAIDKPGFWTADDSSRMTTFMSSSSGHKYKAMLDGMVYKAMANACLDEKQGDYARGIAQGLSLVNNFTVTLVNYGKRQEQDFSESDGVNTDNSGLEQLARR